MRLLVLAVLVSAVPLSAQQPMDAAGWIDRGTAEFKAANFRQAAADFQRAVQSDPSNVNAHLYLATAWMQQVIPGADSPDNRAVATAADGEFRKVLELEPGNLSAMLSLGSVNLSQKKWDEAQAWYEKVVAAHPRNANAWYSMGFIVWSRWYPPYMAARASLGMRPEDPGPLPPGAEKADLITRYGAVIDAGLRDFQQALQIDPQNDDSMAYLNLLIRERADLRDSSVEYQRDIDEANDWVNKALTTKKAKSEQKRVDGIAAPPPPPTPPPPPGAAAADPPGRIRVSGDVMAKMLLGQTAPVYPAEAKHAGISGPVTLAVVVGENGTVKNVTYQEGPLVLAQAAIDAVLHWTYKVTQLNDEPVEVETSVTVNFAARQE